MIISLLYHAATLLNEERGEPTAKQCHVRTVAGAIVYVEVVAKKFDPAPMSIEVS
jgi:hypothetical protein